MGVDFRVIWVADFNNVIRFYVRRHAAGQRTPAARRHTKIQRDYRYIVMGVNFGIIWVADFNNVIRFYVRRPANG